MKTITFNGLTTDPATVVILDEFLEAANFAPGQPNVMAAFQECARRHNPIDYLEQGAIMFFRWRALDALAEKLPADLARPHPEGGRTIFSAEALASAAIPGGGCWDDIPAPLPGL